MAARATKLSRDAIVNAALAFLDREGWDALTINALATQLGTKGPSLYNHVQSLEDLRRTVRMRVIRDIIGMLNAVGDGRTRDDRPAQLPHHPRVDAKQIERFATAPALRLFVGRLVLLRSVTDRESPHGRHRPRQACAIRKLRPASVRTSAGLARRLSSALEPPAGL